MPATVSRFVQHWLQAWAGGREPVEQAPRPVALDAIRCAMVRSVRGCTEHHRALAADRVMAARGAMELWLLRCDLHQYLARDLGEAEARRRVEALAGMFEGHVAVAQPQIANRVH